MRVVTLSILLNSFIFADFHCNISPLPSTIKEGLITKNSWHNGCPVPLEDLSYIRLSYFDFKNKEQVGELIVNRKISQITCSVFKKLYAIKYPIEKMRLVSYYNSDDTESMKHNNTSAFNCRLMTGSKTKWSNHSYGLAIDINPLINPYLSKLGTVSPSNGKKYLKRLHTSHSITDRAKLVAGDQAVEIFTTSGFIWGGNWHSVKDYQHFEYKLNKSKSIKTLFKNLNLPTKNKETSKDLF